MRYRSLRLWRQYRVVVVTGTVLLAAVLTTWVLRQTTVAEVEANEAQWQTNIAENAAEQIEVDFRRRYALIERRARSMASDSVITAALVRARDTGTRSAELLQRVNAVGVEDRVGVEVRGADGELLAWKGEAVPVDPRAVQAAFQASGPISMIEQDGEVRRAMTVWWPVVVKGTRVGIVRTVRLVEFQPPVLNRYIQGFDLESDWRRRTGEAVEVSFITSQQTEAPRSQQTRPRDAAEPSEDLQLRRTLSGVGASPLMTVTVRPPSSDRLIAVQTQKYDSLFILWVVLGAFWAITATWTAYRYARERALRRWNRPDDKASDDGDQYGGGQPDGGQPDGGQPDETRDDESQHDEAQDNENRPDENRPDGSRHDENRHGGERHGGVKRPSFPVAAGWFSLTLAGWIGLRYLMVWLDVPGRWLSSVRRIAPLFDPTHLASTFGGGILQSTGDLLVTALFAIIGSTALIHLAGRIRPRTDSLSDLFEQFQATTPPDPHPFRFFAAITTATVLIMSFVLALAEVVQRSVLDSTLDYFSRTGILPEPLVLIVLCSLFLLAVSAVLAGTAVAWFTTRIAVRHRPSGWPRGLPTLGIGVILLLGIGACYAWPPTRELVPIPVAMTFLGTVAAASTLGVVWPYGGVGQLTLRGLLPSVLALTMLLYPMLYIGMDTQRRDRMVGAALSFEEGRDPRVLFSIKQMLKASRQELDSPNQPAEASASTARGAASGTNPRIQTVAGSPDLAMDSVATRLVSRSLLASLTTYEASLIFIDAEQRPVERFTASGVRARRMTPRESDQRAFEQLRQMYELQRATGPLVDQLQGRRPEQRMGELVYAGIIPLDQPIATGRDGREIAWIMVRAEPRSLLPGAGTGVPAVLLPDGSYLDLYAELSLAEFRNGALARSLGRDFGRARLQSSLRSVLDENQMLWRSETVRGARYLTLYRQMRPASPTGASSLSDPQAWQEQTIAVRIPAVLAFDHLYYILRLTIAGLCVTFLIYLLGLYGRYQRGLLPAPKVRFRDKVLSAFLAVGVVSMIAVGVVGVQVVTGENERVIERRLHDHLNRVEETLALEARPGEMMYRVAERVDLDSLAARVGLDLRMYEGPELRGTSRARLVRDRLVDRRIPIEVYRALYEETYRFTMAPSFVGSFQYVVGYQALPGEDGTPRYVLAVPTLAQQERIEEEQARTLAYLFGALLILVVVVMLTALLLANALARPIAQLREGLEAVGEGRFARVLPVDTRDEIGDLVRTFNEMREQLRESRRKLAKQERELAWREMARQVAHEIKNPLTPMKLSIQHLQRAFQKERTEHGGENSGFEAMFDRITETLIEQIEALARIANEFSSFARLPTRVLEPMDLNEVIQEAVRLMREEASDVDIEMDLEDTPLVVKADREELRRIFINLIKNAIQAIPDHRDGHITVRTAPETGEGDAAPAVRCEIADNGTGIPASLRDKIFQPNFSTKTSGTGLGLAIARKSIEELDGQIGFETVEGEGTTFWIRLPLSEQATVNA
jgi:two-component system, NtrC family, nitrogen regulation sensor histidine kinase NtrY